MGAAEIATWLCGLAIVVGVLGIIIPVIPGTILIAAAVLIWAIVVQTTGGWIVLGVVLGILALGEVIKYAIAGKRIASSGVPRKSLIIAGLAGIVGFFVFPLFGLFIGFVLGLTVAEYLRQQDWPTAWASSKMALKAVGIMLLIDLTSALLAATSWGIGLWRGVL